MHCAVLLVGVLLALLPVRPCDASPVAAPWRSRSRRTGAAAASLRAAPPMRDGAAQDSTVPPEEFSALVDMYFELGGPYWTEAVWPISSRLQNQSADNPCQWPGIMCSSHVDSRGFAHVLELTLHENNLKGVLPASVANLTHVYSLDVGGNIGLRGDVSAVLSALSLHTLDLSATMASGDVNLLTSGSPSLSWIEIVAHGSPESWVGDFDAFIADHRRLGVLTLSSTSVHGSVRSLELLSDTLSHVTLESNAYLSGELPSDVFTFRNVLYVALNDMGRVSGNLPDLSSNGGASAIRPYIYLGDLKLSGTISTTLIQSASSLELVNLPFVSGSLPPGPWTDPGGFITLHLAGLGVSGTLPSNLFNISHDPYGDSYRLAISRMPHVSGTMPAFPGWLMTISELEVSSMPLLSGTLTPGMVNMASVKSIDIFGLPMLSGSLPTGLLDLPELSRLAIYDTAISSSLPEVLGEWGSLVNIVLDSNNLVGTLPESFCNMPLLQSISLGWNSLSGTIPPCFPKLALLRLNNNYISELPVNMIISETSTLIHLDLRWNNVTVPGQGFFVDCPFVDVAVPTLRHLDLSYNHWSGHGIPDVSEVLQCYVWNGLDSLILDGMPMQARYYERLGTVVFLPSLLSLAKLSLSNCSLAGQLMTTYDTQGLRELDLSYNVGVVGSVPHALSALTHVDVSGTNLDICTSALVYSKSLVSLVARDVPLGFCTERVNPTIIMDESFQVEDGERQVTCPRWRLPKSGALVDVNPGFRSFEGCTCSTGHYFGLSFSEFSMQTAWLVPVDVLEMLAACHACPRHLDCDRNASLSSVPNHVLRGAYYPMCETPVAVGDDGHHHGGHNLAPCFKRELLPYAAAMLSCRHPLVCNAGRFATSHPSDVRCRSGHLEDSLMCSECDTDHYMRGLLCQKCHKSFVWLVPIVLVVAVGLFAALLAKTVYNPSPSAAFSIALFFFQLMATLTQINQTNAVASSSSSRSSTAVEDRVGAFSHVQSLLETLASFSPFAIECVVPRLGFRAYSYVLLLMPAILVLLIGVVARVYSSLASAGCCGLGDRGGRDDDGRIAVPLLEQQEQGEELGASATEPHVFRPALIKSAVLWRRTRRKAIQASVFALMAVYFPVVHRTFQMFNCRNVDGLSGHASLSYLASAAYIDCDSDAYLRGLRILALMNLLLFVLPWPLVVGWRLNRLQRAKVLRTEWPSHHAGLTSEQSSSSEHSDTSSGFDVDTGVPFDSRSKKSAASSVTGDALLELESPLHFLTTSIRPGLWWWPLVLLVRSLVLALAIGMIAFDSVFLPLVVFALLLIALLLQVRLAPYSSSRDNLLEVITLSATVLLYLANIVAGVGDSGSFYNTHGVETLIIALYVCVILSFIAAAALTWFRNRRRQPHTLDAQ